MRILHLVNHVRNVGNGIVNVVVDLAIEQARQQHNVLVASAGGEFVRLLESNGVTHIDLPQAGSKAAPALFRLARLLNQQRPDIIAAHMMTGALLARIVSALSGAKVVTTVHNSFQRHAILMGCGDKVIAVSEAVREEMVAKGMPAAKMCTVRNATVGSLRGMTAKALPRVNMAHPAVLCVAGLYPRKGIADIIEAVKLLRSNGTSVTFYIAGEGPERSNLEAQVREIGMEKEVVFLGMRTDVASLLQEADIFVLASHHEPFGLVLSEARESGLPIVATDVGGIAEALDGGRAGLLVAPGQPAAIADAIHRILTDSSLRALLIDATRHNLEALHVARMASDTLAVYRLALGESPREQAAQLVA